MTKEQVVGLSIFLSIVIAIVTLLIFVAVRNNIYKKFVIANSDSIKRIKELNNKYMFREYINTVRYHHRFDSKGNWKRTEPVAYLTREIRNNLEHWFSIRDSIEFNKTTGEEYVEEVEKAFKPIAAGICLANKKRHKKCCSEEKRIFNSLIKRPLTSIKIVVALQYVSRKGQVNISKSESFDYIALNRILDAVSTYRVDRKTYERLATAERAMLSDSMRYDVLRRDGFRCVLCGMSAKDGAFLHVDHIIPVSKGGKTVPSNLRTLCEKCNLGKSNKIE